MLGMTQGALANAAGLAERTIFTFEKTGKISRSPGIAIRAVLEARGCRFWEGEQEAGVTMRLSAA